MWIVGSADEAEMSQLQKEMDLTLISGINSSLMNSTHPATLRQRGRLEMCMAEDQVETTGWPTSSATVQTIPGPHQALLHLQHVHGQQIVQQAFLLQTAAPGDRISEKQTAQQNCKQQRAIKNSPAKDPEGYLTALAASLCNEGLEL